MFSPELKSPIKTLDIPLGGSVSPVDALSLLIEYLLFSASHNQSKVKTISEYQDDTDGNATVEVLDRALEIPNWITGNSSRSLGLHPAVYFYNEKGKHSRFLFLAMVSLITEKVVNNNTAWFKTFAQSRRQVEVL